MNNAFLYTMPLPNEIKTVSDMRVYFSIKYPELFVKYTANNLNHIGYEPLECNLGWFHLLDELFMFMTMYLGKNTSIHISQIKEKFGSLRVYTNTYNPELENLIFRAEEKSKTICEFCGKPGSLRKDLRWIKTQCDDCYKAGYK